MTTRTEADGLEPDALWLAPEDLRLALERLRAAGAAFERERGRMRRAELLRCWRVLAEVERARVQEGRKLERLKLLDELLTALEGTPPKRVVARRALEGALLAGAGELLAALAGLRRGVLEGLADQDLMGALVGLEEALLTGLTDAGGERLKAAEQLRVWLMRDGSGALLLRSGSLAGDLLRTRGWLALLRAGLEELLRGREVEQFRKKQRLEGARAGGVPAIPAAVVTAAEGLLLPKRIVAQEERDRLEQEGAATPEEREGSALYWSTGERCPHAVCAGWLRSWRWRGALRCQG